MTPLELLRRALIGRRVHITDYPHEEPRHIIGLILQILEAQAGNDVWLVVGDTIKSARVNVWDIRAFEFVDEPERTP
jgi:hypothetical protein